HGLKKDNVPYKGIIFIGLMNGYAPPFVIEYNLRMGDPESESIDPRIETDFDDQLQGLVKAELHTCSSTVWSKTAEMVRIVSCRYPGGYETDKGIANIENIKESIVFHAGTKSQNGETLTAGGRVLAVTALEDDLFSALQQATADAGRIFFEGKYFRTDIGFDLI